MSARELFYNAGSAPAPKPSPIPAKKKVDPVVVAKRNTPAPAAPQTADAAVQPKPTAPPAPEAPSASEAPSTPDGSGKIISVASNNIAFAPAPTGPALGLKYTLLKLTGDGMTPTAPSSVFHAGDKIQFSIETNSPGYLYIVSQGSSGTWKPIFPSPEIEGGNNHIEAFHSYTLPAGYRVGFDQQPGDEKLFIIFSRDAKPDFEQLVYSLQGKPQPASAPQQARPSEHTLRASIDDASVGRLHETYARDLIVEKIGDDAHASADPAQEKATYVVNPTGSPDSAVVADLHLVHQ